MRELLNSCLYNNMSVVTHEGICIDYRQVLFHDDKTTGWTRSYIDPRNLHDADFMCKKCNTQGWFDCLSNWKVYPTNNTIYISHKNMSHIIEIPKCTNCFSNKHFIILN